VKRVNREVAREHRLVIVGNGDLFGSRNVVVGGWYRGYRSGERTRVETGDGRR
jgi:hypothetical protein